jgi:hypothetical protein
MLAEKDKVHENAKDMKYIQLENIFVPFPFVPYQQQVDFI